MTEKQYKQMAMSMASMLWFVSKWGMRIGCHTIVGKNKSWFVLCDASIQYESDNYCDCVDWIFANFEFRTIESIMGMYHRHSS